MANRASSMESFQKKLATDQQMQRQQVENALTAVNKAMDEQHNEHIEVNEATKQLESAAQTAQVLQRSTESETAAQAQAAQLLQDAQAKLQAAAYDPSLVSP